VYFTQEFDDPGLIAVDARIMAIAVAGLLAVYRAVAKQGRVRRTTSVAP
jgi:hypothetical protein